MNTPPEIPHNMQGSTFDNNEKTNTGIATGSAVPDAPPKILRNEADSDDDNNINEDEEKDDSDDDDSDIATITVNLRTSVELQILHNSFPQTVMVLEVDFNGMETNPEHLVEVPPGTEFHEIVDRMEWYMHLVDERLFHWEKVQKACPLRPSFHFESFEHLQDLLQESKKNQGSNDGSWMNKLLREPGLQRINVVFAYRAYRNTGRMYKLLGENGKDITVGQFVKAFRDQLQHAEADIRKFSGELSLICNKCLDDAIDDD